MRVLYYVVVHMVTNVRIICHSCGGQGFLWEDEYPGARTGLEETDDIRRVKVVCYECNGDCYVTVQQYVDN